jgi:putative glutamine amidotransferase
MHPVRIEEGSRLRRILEADEVQVCSWHHQAVDRVGAGLRPTAWAAYGLIEGLELDSHPWCVAVQWHPEMQLEDETQQRLFAALVRAAEESRDKHK